MDEVDGCGINAIHSILWPTAGYSGVSLIKMPNPTKNDLKYLTESQCCYISIISLITFFYSLDHTEKV